MKQVWLRSWSEDLDVHTPEDLTIIGEKAGMSKDQIEACLADMKSDEVKKRLKEVTEEAIDRGAFGSPTMFFTDQNGDNEQMFWGSDRFEMVAAMYDKPWHGPDPTTVK